MKNLIALVLLSVSFTASPLSTTVQALEARTVEVTFKPGVKASTIQEISAAFSSPARQIKDQRWVFDVPALKTQDQFAELFASLASVSSTIPVPAYKIADHIQPQAVNLQPVEPTALQRTSTFMPGELLVKFKANASLDDIRFINSHNDANVLSRIAGIDVYRLQLPQGVSVEEALQAYSKSPLVEYAEPNYRMGVPTPVASPTPDPSASPQPSPSATSNLPTGTLVATQIPLDGGGQMLIHFRPGTPEGTIQKFHRLYGTREVKKESFYSYRVQLPAGLNPHVAARIFKLYPGVSDVQKLYS